MTSLPRRILPFFSHAATRVAALYFAFSLLWIFGSDAILEAWIEDPILLVRLSIAKGVAFVVVTTLLLYLVLRTWTGPVDDAAAPGTREPRLRWLIVILAGLFFVAPLLAFSVVRVHGPAMRAHAMTEISAIAELKAGQLETWLRERRVDAETLGERPGFVRAVERWLRDGGEDARSLLFQRMEMLARGKGHTFALLHADGRMAPHPDPADEGADPVSVRHWQTAYAAALDSGEARHSDLYLDAAGRVRLDYIVPLFRPLGDTHHLSGFVVLRVPVRHDLLPLERYRREPEQDGLLLARREGGDVAFLDLLNQGDEASPALRHHLDIPGLQDVIAQLGGETRVVEGRDHLGVRVFAAVRPIAGSSWHLVATAARAEKLQSLYDLVFWVALVAMAAVAIIALLVILFWRQLLRAHRLELLAQAAEEAQRFRAIFDAAVDGILIADAETRRFVMANPAICAMLGHTADEIIRLGVEDIHPPEVLPQAREAFDALAHGGPVSSLDIPVRRRDGSILQVSLKASRLRIGGRSMLVGIFRDVTERRQMEERLRQSATVFESTQDGVTITDLAGNILAVNRAFEDITGYAEAEVLGKNPRVLHSGRQDEAFYQTLWVSVRETGSWQGEIWNRRKNGEIYPEWLNISTVYDEHGAPVNYVGVFSDISRLKRSEERLEHLAHYDPLTELPNRLLVQSRLQHAVEQAQRAGRRIGALLIDLDHFKTINESYGHPTGDDLLIAVTRRLRERVRAGDTFGRLGGDEFLLVLEQLASPQDAAVVARDLLDALAAPFRLLSGLDVYVGASIGIAVFPDDGKGATELLRGADGAMYRAKEQGRNGFAFYATGMDVDAAAQLELETALRRARERNELLLYFQPKVSLRDGRVSGAEALIRWRRDDGELVPPYRFIPLAEKTGLIADIGAWVIDEACRQASDWREAGLGEVRVAVNVSAGQFFTGDLCKVVADALRRHAVTADCLELEVTESLLMKDQGVAVELLSGLKALGVQLSIDDFGTGYSSFAYLHRFPVDALKVDGSFVSGVPADPDAAMIVAAIIDLAHRMRLKVVAEGVETESQLGYLRAQGCDEIQGYHFSRPLPAEAFAALLREDRRLSPWEC
ncbi:MAG: EAL domain-containing protein [Chromatiales bacterium]|nr:EAL domain-containing protein [Chromatiales bacterium]